MSASLKSSNGEPKGGWVGALAVCVLAAWIGVAGLVGCGTPGAPQPPSLKLPEPVKDLSAVRAGGSVALEWTMPGKSTDRLMLRGQIPILVCFKDSTGACQTVGQLALAPRARGQFQVAVPRELKEGDVRPVSFFVEVKSPRGRSAGLSNAAVVLAGSAPPPIADLRAEVGANGVALHWREGGAGGAGRLVRLHRRLIGPIPGSLGPALATTTLGNGGSRRPEPILRDLLVDEPQASGQAVGALDATARFGQVYEYTAQALRRVAVAGATLELAGEDSAPVRVSTVDNFPPAAPQGLAAVGITESNRIDLSWQPNTEEDLAGYAVYRSEGASGEGDRWQRVSGAQPLTGPAYGDAGIVPGKVYRYAVTALDQLGNESQRSSAAEAALQSAEPNP